MKGTLWAVSAVGALTACVVGYVLLGSNTHRELTIFACIALGVAAINLWWEHRKSDRHNYLPFVITLIGMTSAAMSFAIGRALQSIEIGRARSYPQQATSALETYRKQHGLYPQALNELHGAPAPPRLIRYHRRPERKGNGRTWGERYEFTFDDPAHGHILFGSSRWCYASDEPKWRYVPD